jgi:putative peptidoglycan binding protein
MPKSMDQPVRPGGWQATHEEQPVATISGGDDHGDHVEPVLRDHEGDQDGQDAGSSPGSHRPQKRKRRTALAVAAVLAIGALTTGLVLLNSAGETGTPAEHPASTATVTVTKTDMSNTLQVPGTLGYGAELSLRGAKSGLITRLTHEGATITRGHTLYWVDDQPVALFYGGTPLFRELAPPQSGARSAGAGSSQSPAPAPAQETAKETTPESGAKHSDEEAPGASAPAASTGPSAGPGSAAPEQGGTRQSSPLRGRDVKVVADNLRALGYDIGPQPGGDRGTYTQALSDAVKRWQRDTGAAATGVLGAGDVVVQPGKVRIGGLKASLGDDAAGELMTVTSTRKSVLAKVTVEQMANVANGAKATVVLPNNAQITGHVTRIGRVLEDGDSQDLSQSGGGPTVNVTVSLDSGREVKDLDQANVSVQFESQTHKGVFAVPVGALLALREGGYALQEGSGKLLPVETGLFSQGMVEVKGPGLREGLRVVTTS